MTRPDGDADSVEPEVAPADEEETFDRTIDEGRQRLGRSWLQLIATGMLGGLDIGVGVLTFLLVKHLTGDPLLSALAFSIGFIALTMAKSELFTENFLVPVAAVVAKEATAGALARLWGTTLVTNLAAGWFIAALLMLAFPDLRRTAAETAADYANLGTTWQSFALAVVGGMLVTLMTHLQHSTDSDGLRLVPAVVIGFTLSVGHVNHAIVATIFCFAALVSGASFGYVDVVDMLWLAILGNAVGGLGLVTVLRLMQVPHKVAEARNDTRPAPQPR
ncbi:formate/nitrite transporter family protein [Mycolicibacterium confluentis]|uniref:Formate transporter n=1 Tax=Mycolicibacterium confluentis TaxID=28047 RepID=A0A7I7XW75_9MYCO|nr:formate/nitrite transporter family protein [Mycolicibacterium confluentis]MCV7321728.1 formate/nitrite transporter family protein [Mycolicibacterium confluentis]ORV32009.1 formate transporter [Mycolicibacterium confluentis]BBZ33539.1 formate transporter [Mycolicibacterium confluentis]